MIIIYINGDVDLLISMSKYVLDTTNNYQISNMMLVTNCLIVIGGNNYAATMIVDISIISMLPKKNYNTNTNV